MRILNKLNEVMNNLLEGKNRENEPDNNRDVYILLKAMVNAVKSDGKIDTLEQERVMKFMDDMTGMQKMFIEQELKSSLNLENFLQEIPEGMEQQVYYMSLFAIDLDVDAEKDYLDMLGKKLKLSPEIIFNIHKDLGVVK